MRALESEHLFPWEFCEWKLEGALSLGALKDMPNKALGMGFCFHRGPEGYA